MYDSGEFTMIGFLKDLLLSQNTEPDHERTVRIAAASLLVAMTRADSKADDVELRFVRHALAGLLSISDGEVDHLLKEAEREVNESVSLYDFTKILHQQQTKEERIELVRLLWSVACADGEIDPQEELLVRKVSSLIYLSQEEFISAKKAALADFAAKTS